MCAGYSGILLAKEKPPYPNRTRPLPHDPVTPRPGLTIGAISRSFVCGGIWCRVAVLECQDAFRRRHAPLRRQLRGPTRGMAHSTEIDEGFLAARKPS